MTNGREYYVENITSILQFDPELLNGHFLHQATARTRVLPVSLEETRAHTETIQTHILP